MCFDRFSEGTEDIQDDHGCSVCGEVIYDTSEIEAGMCGLCQWSAQQCEEDFEEDDSDD